MVGAFLLLVIQGSALSINFDNWGSESHVFYYVIGSEKDTGSMVQVFEKERDGYVFIKYIKQTQSNTVIEDSAVLIMDKTGRPKWYYEKTGMIFGNNPPVYGIVIAEYKDSVIEIFHASSDGKVDTFQIRPQGIVYPTGFVPFLLEGVPIGRNDTLVFKVVFPVNGVIDNAIAVGIEEVELETPVGKKKSDKVKLQLGRRSSVVWYGKETPRRILKYVDKAVDVEYLIKKIAK